MIRVIIAIFILFCTVDLYAAPSITGVSGTSSLTISGSDFGSKTTAAPIKWDNFEWGSPGDLITTDTVSPTWEPDTPGETNVAEINTTHKHSGTRSVYKAMTANNGDCAFYDAGIYFAETQELYISYWIRYESVHGSDLNGPRADFFKFNRINSGSDIYGGSPSFLINLYPNYDSPETGRIEVHQYWDGGTPGYNVGRHYNNDMRSGQWHRVEMWLKLSNPGGTLNGDLQYFFNAAEITIDWSGNTVTRTETEPYEYLTKSATTTNNIDTFSLLFGGCGYDADDYPLLWQDDVYVDNTRARVEIGDAATWSTCTHREIQIPTSWSTSFISATINSGAFTTGETVYVYVINQDGEVNTDGYPITIGQSTGPAIGSNIGAGASIQ